MKIVNFSDSELGAYVQHQIKNIIPLNDDSDFALIMHHMKVTLQRLNRCIDQIKPWEAGRFDVLHSSQYCIFLYFLANTIWRSDRAHFLCTKLFLLNKALNAIDCFYEIELPEVFFIGHSVGIVLANATYGNHLVLYQNSTIGKNHGVAPVLEDGVILYPNVAVIGNCRVRTGSVISQGTRVINQDTQANMVAYQGSGGGLVFKPSGRIILADFFRDIQAT